MASAQEASCEDSDRTGVLIRPRIRLIWFSAGIQGKRLLETRIQTIFCNFIAEAFSRIFYTLFENERRYWCAPHRLLF